MPVTTILPAYDRLDDLRELFREYTSSLGIDLSFQDYAAELAALPGKYAPPDGRLYLALVDGKPAGCVGLRRLDAGRCEMKRLYVRPAFRGLRLGDALVRRVIDDAASLGYRRMLLDTLPSMRRAIGLYRGLGFVDIAPYYHNPVEGTVYLADRKSVV